MGDLEILGRLTFLGALEGFFWGGLPILGSLLYRQALHDHHGVHGEWGAG